MSRMTRSLENLGIAVILGGALGFIAPIGAVGSALAAAPFSGTFVTTLAGVGWLPIIAMMSSIAGIALGLAAWAGSGAAVLLTELRSTSMTARVIAVGVGAMLGAAIVIAAAASLRGIIVDFRYGAFAIALTGGLAATVVVIRSTTAEGRAAIRD